MTFKLGVASSMEKVYFDRQQLFEAADTVELAVAGGEYESFQLVIQGHRDTLRSIRSRTEGFGFEKDESSPVSVSFNPVGYVHTTVVCDKYDSSIGWWPDPLLETGSFDLAPGEIQPVWVTVHVPRGTAAGYYYATIKVSTDGGGSREVPVKLRVWGFDLPRTPSIKTLTWVSDLSSYYGYRRGSPEAVRAKRKMYDLLLSHRLGPGGNIELTDEDIAYCMERGMNAFLLHVIPNLKRRGEEEYSASYKRELVQKLESYVRRFGPRGWLDGKAYVYNYDEVGREHWPQAKQMYELVKSVSQELRVIQCLNIPEGVKAMAGFADTWDVYVAQYEKTEVQQRVADGDEAWLAVCCYPVDRPNFFLEYPAIDGRLLGWICWQTGVTGFEYWSPNSWGENEGFPQLRGNWTANTFRNYNGDGYLTYPGPGGNPLASIRLANLRDGLEDYEYLRLLAELQGEVHIAGEVAVSTTRFTSDPRTVYRVREIIALKIEQALNRQKD
ncbi:MAG: DUF4091 domain-containing protein [Candidatus Glassbacteria bacterium]|nr:DUF4091 domain-containing protein [Candidatus Glassbacteria bacterium]